MFTLLSISGLVVLVIGVLVFAVLLARLLTEWLSNRPDSQPQYSQEDILSEIDEVFVDREVLSFSVNLQSVPVLLYRLTEAVGFGFTSRQAETLAHRVIHQHVQEYYQATYPIEVNGVPSDLEFQWCREQEDAVRIAICAVEEVLKFAAEAIDDLAIERGA